MRAVPAVAENSLSEVGPSEGRPHSLRWKLLLPLRCPCRLQLSLPVCAEPKLLATLNVFGSPDLQIQAHFGNQLQDAGRQPGEAFQ